MGGQRKESYQWFGWWRIKATTVELGWWLKEQGIGGSKRSVGRKWSFNEVHFMECL